MIPLLAVHTFAEYYRLPWKPPVTAGLLAANTLIYLRPAALDALLPSVDEVLFNAHLILKVRSRDDSLVVDLFYLSPCQMCSSSCGTDYCFAEVSFIGESRFWI